MFNNFFNYYRTYDFTRNRPDLYYDNILPNISKNLYNGKYLDNNFSEFLSLVNPEKVMNKSYEPKDYGASEITRMKSKYENIYQDYKNKFNNNTLKWQRVSFSVYKNEEYDLFKSSSIIQGSLGNCFMISFLKGMQKFQKQRFDNLFYYYYYDIGYFEVELYTDQGKKWIFVDDIIPYYSSNNAPYFSHLNCYDKSKACRLLLIEKVLAKYYDSYENIKGRNVKPNKFIYALTGKDPKCLYSIYYTIEDGGPDNKLNKIYWEVSSGLSKNAVIVITSSANVKVNGILSNHAYAIIDVSYYYNIIVFTLYNPHGYNDQNSMKNFRVNLNNNDAENYLYNYNNSALNLNNGNLKIDGINLINNFNDIYITYF